MSCMTTIYKKYNFKIYSDKHGYIIHNTKLEFDKHHTHINNYKTCKFIIDLCIHKTIPKHLSDYLLVSIIRITEDKRYKDEIYKILENSNKKKNKQYKGSKNIPENINRSRKVNKYERNYGSKSTKNKTSKRQKG